MPEHHSGGEPREHVEQMQPDATPQWARDQRALELRAEGLARGLRAIAGELGDEHGYISAYRFAGGGYEGLQAIAKACLDDYGPDAKEGE